MVNDASRNAASVNRFEKRTPITTPMTLAVGTPYILKGNHDVTLPTGEDGQRVNLTYVRGAVFSVLGDINTSLGDDTSLVIAANDPVVELEFVFNSSTGRWEL